MASRSRGRRRRYRLHHHAPGQKLINPAAGAAVKVYFTIEEYDGDLDMTEIFSDCIITSLKFSMGSSGLLMVDIAWVGTGLFTTASGLRADLHVADDVDRAFRSPARKRCCAIPRPTSPSSRRGI
jgi:hypothetical protein